MASPKSPRSRWTTWRFLNYLGSLSQLEGAHSERLEYGQLPGLPGKSHFVSNSSPRDRRFAMTTLRPPGRSLLAPLLGLVLFAAVVRIALVAALAPASSAKPSAPPEIVRLRVVDEQGKPLTKFDVEVFPLFDRGDRFVVGQWLTGHDGRAMLDKLLHWAQNEETVDLIVRADGFASSVMQFTGPEQATVKQGEAQITLKRGQEVEIVFRLPPGVAWPEGVTPQVYLESAKASVYSQWIPPRMPAGATREVWDGNELGTIWPEPGTARLRLAADTPPLRVAINAPGFLRFFERGPFTFSDFKDGRLEIDVPRPTALEVHFDAGATDPAKLPFQSVSLNVGCLASVRKGAYKIFIDEQLGPPWPSLSLTDLAPGKYSVLLQTVAKPDVVALPEVVGCRVNPGRFIARKKLSLQAGEAAQIELTYAPFDPDAFRGDSSASLEILNTDWSPAVGRSVLVIYSQPHYGPLKVFSDVVPASGTVTIEGITDRAPEEATGPYSVFLEPQPGEQDRLVCLGDFSLTPGPTTSEFTFRLPPSAGSMAPDVEMVNLKTGASVRLSDFRGRVVLLDFWATWCGTCQEPTKRMNQAVVEQHARWKNQFVILPLSIDRDVERLKAHVNRRGWTNLDHFWSGEDEADAYNAPAARAFVVDTVPTALLIGRDGKILWRGNPNADDLDARIDAALRN
jgi:thiol-disulfide isomerase/thioredoxin